MGANAILSRVLGPRPLRPDEGEDLDPWLRSRIVVDSETGCWLWTGSTSGDGYGKVHWDGRTRYAHRVVYECLVAYIGEELVLDHVHERGCRHKNCVNAEHLEPVTVAENSRRGQHRRRARERAEA